MKKFAKAGDIKVGAIGYGGAFNMGLAHLKEMERAGMKPTAVAELDSSRLEVAKRDFPGIETYQTVDAMLKKSDVNLLAIITPHNTHAKLAVQCLKAGRHVVAEKPMAITTAECDTMIAAAKKSGVVLSTYHNRHWDGIILGAMNQIRNGTIGEVVRVEVEMGGMGKPGDWWRSSKSISGGILFDWGVHLLEYTLQMVNSEVEEVSGYLWNGAWADQTKWKKDCNEDEGHVVVRYASGAWSMLTVTSLDGRPNQPWFKVVGTSGTMTLDWGATEVVNLCKDGSCTKRIGNPPSEGWRLYQNVADHLTGKEKLVITPEWARRPIHILDLAHQSAKLGRALKSKYA